MKTKNKERRVINIDKKDYDVIKKYCDENALNASKWLSKIALEKIQQSEKKYWIPSSEIINHLKEESE